MQNQPDFNMAFENSIVELCHSMGKDGVKKLDTLLTQEKDHLQILADINNAFPQFQDLFSKELSKGYYASN